MWWMLFWSYLSWWLKIILCFWIRLAHPVYQLLYVIPPPCATTCTTVCHPTSMCHHMYYCMPSHLHVSPHVLCHPTSMCHYMYYCMPSHLHVPPHVLLYAIPPPCVTSCTTVCHHLYVLCAIPPLNATDTSPTSLHLSTSFAILLLHAVLFSCVSDMTHLY